MFERIRKKISRARHEELSEAEETLLEKIDVDLTANMRALRLAATMADQLLSRGMAAGDVVHLVVGVTTTYCSRRVHIDIAHTILTVSQDRGVDREPLTLVRTITSRGADYQTVQLLEELADSITIGRMSLDDAEKRLDGILARPRLYPRWVTYASAGGVSAGVVMLYSHNPVVWAIAFLMGMLVNMALFRMARMGLPSFYAQVIAGIIIAVIAAAASLAAYTDAIPLLDSVNSTLIIIGGIVLLLAGMMIVSAFQDAIDEYYITATARLLKVIMMTGGIVLGITIGIYLATRLGVTLAATPDRLSLADINFQYIGAAVLSASFALGNQTRILGVLCAGLVGFMSLYIVLVMTTLGFGIIPSSGIAAAYVGLAATVLLRLFRIPTIATINAGIIPLVPGLTLYTGLTYIAQAAPNTTDFDNGVTFLMRALLIAIIVAAGATFGNLLGRPARRRLVHIHNRLPRHRLGEREKPTN